MLVTANPDAGFKHHLFLLVIIWLLSQYFAAKNMCK
jgi:hypothetical protein